MLFSYSLIKRYTPPTCTLEIWGKASSLSFLMNRHRLEAIKFELHFDDPKTLEEEQMTLKGDRNDLQTLCDIVTLYVENLLSTAPTSLPLQRLSTFAPSSLVSVIETPPLTPETLSLPSLKPISLLSHQLSLGSLAPNEIETEINLSVSQLFDLANVLEEYSLEAEILPTLKPESTGKKKLIWGISIAGLAALAFGGIALKNDYFNPKPVALNSSPQQKENQSTIQDILPPVPLPPSNFSVPSPTTPPNLGQREKLSPSNTVEAGKTPPRNPSVVTVIPPTAIIPPPPVVPPAPEKTTIVLTPNPSNIPAPPNLPSSGNQIPVPERGNTVPALSDSVIPPLSQIDQPKLSSLPPLSSSESTPPPPSLSSAQNNPAPQPSAALLDAIPQVTEVREYFQQRWQPPENLKQTLEYRLQLNSDGSLARIMPLGRSAAIYLDRTNMPLLGEPFVSPPPESLKNPQIRLVLSPDKRVKTFLEEQ